MSASLPEKPRVRDDAPPRSMPLLVLAAVLAVVTALALFVILAGAWGLTAEYGSTAVPAVGALPWAVLPTVLLTATWAVTRAAVQRSARRWWLVALASLAVITAVLAVVIALADRQHDADAVARGSACSAADSALLASVPGYSADFGGPTGQDDGACTITIPVLGDTAAAMSSVIQELELQGWETSGITVPDSTTQLTNPDGDTIVVSSAGTDDKGITDVVVAVPAS